MRSKRGLRIQSCDSENEEAAEVETTTGMRGVVAAISDDWVDYQSSYFVL